MIARYSRPEMMQVWTSESKYQSWLEVELAVCKAMNKIGLIPDADLQNILTKAQFDTEKIDEIESNTKHDVIAFLTNVAEFVGESSRWLHFGMTSSDMLDTALALQCRKAGVLILQSLKELCNSLKKRAIEFKDTLCIGRSHGIHAEPTSFGLKFVLWYDEMNRNIERIEQAIERISVGKISGAVGNFAHISPEVEILTCEYLGLKPSKISTQIIQRDTHAEFLTTIALIGTTIDKIAIEIRHLQRTEVREVEENFSKGQKGSSAMPHKKNPITSEQLSGLARILRANAQTAMENNVLWHERDISHSSVERIILPDSTILLHYMLYKLKLLIENLVVYPENIKKNLDITNGLVFSQVLLLKITECCPISSEKKGEKNLNPREYAYTKIQNHALECWKHKIPFKSLIENDEELMNLICKDELDAIFSYDRYLQNVDFIYKRVGIF
ncbi:MAG: adenylosuccinate lyase [Candidatus Cloacimonetes bacterium]|nr:adenylosuccinate lyase [Candidatus Cloacimonadota bacterium]